MPQTDKPRLLEIQDIANRPRRFAAGQQRPSRRDACPGEAARPQQLTAAMQAAGARQGLHQDIKDGML